ncbi:MAG: hypothetical protein HN576_16615 [Bacteriovoracaceae bacterium]|jgi:hypothetical protein|nr:hypothetical protein [Bacteriovoracaceae bacterium]
MNKTLIVLTIFTLYSCSNTIRILPQATKAPKENLINKYFHGADEIEISQSAVHIEGAFKGLKKTNYIDISNCSYTYSKGRGIAESEKPFKYQTIKILLTGKDQEGVDTFERLIYSNVDLISDFKEWNYNKSFGPISLNNSLESNSNYKNSTMTFKKYSDHAEIIFAHSDMFGTKKSKFYKEGEKRDYKINLIYSKFEATHIKLSKILVQVNSSIDQGQGNFTKSNPLIQAVCTEFNKFEIEKD